MNSGNTRRFTGVPEHLMGKNLKCFYCDRVGHVAANCRSRTGACFICGSFEHFFNNCERRRGVPDHSHISRPSWNAKIRPSIPTQISERQNHRFQSKKICIV
jgi:hypothetical protein